MKTYRVLELRIDFSDDFPHRLEFGKHVFLRCATAKHGLHLQDQLDTTADNLQPERSA